MVKVQVLAAATVGVQPDTVKSEALAPVITAEAIANGVLVAALVTMTVLAVAKVPTADELKATVLDVTVGFIAPVPASDTC
jgi:hypothetical protein